jgi:thiamine-phosphate pyrophosphorylase
MTAENFEALAEVTLALIGVAVEEKVALIQIREKSLDARRLFKLVQAAVEITRGSDSRLLVNDRADVATAAGAQGVHLTSRSIPASVIKRIFPQLIIGVSVHDADEAAEARDEGADFSLFGPVFATPGKDKPAGLDGLETVCRDIGDFPIIAVGGVDHTNSSEVLKAGAAGFAAIRALNDPDGLRAAAETLRSHAG